MLITNMLNEDILIQVLLELTLIDIIRARQTCHALCRATRAKIIWLRILETLISQDGVALPPHLSALNSRQIEAIVIRVVQVKNVYASGYMAPKSVVRLDLPLSVTWLRIVKGRWLFVASSDNYTSKLSCWDIWRTLQGDTKPIAECFLSGPVNTGEIEMQPTGIVIALGIGPRSAIQVLSLRRRFDQVDFVEIKRLTGFHRVLLLHGDFICCGLRNDIDIPQIINWKTSNAHPLLNIPSQNGGPIAVTVWRNLLVLVGCLDIQVFSMPSHDHSPHMVHSFGFERCIFEAIFLYASESPSLTSVNTGSFDEGSSLYFAVMSDEQLDVIRLDLQGGISSASEPFCFNMQTIHQGNPIPRTFIEDAPWYRLRAGSSGQCGMWLAQSHLLARSRPSPLLICATFDGAIHELPADGHASNPLQVVNCTGDLSQLPSLWAYPHFDFDDTLGLAAIGNVFGELALIDYASTTASAELGSISEDVFITTQCDLRSVAVDPILLDQPPLIPTPSRFFKSATPFDSLVTARFTTDITLFGHQPKLPNSWTTDWSNCLSWNQWHGFPGDNAWIIQQVFGFWGQVIPIAFCYHDVLIQVGGLYFIYENWDNGVLYAIQPGVSLSSIMALPMPMFECLFDRRDDMLRRVTHIRLSRFRETEQFFSIWKEENEVMRRNRWADQKARGGRPHENLLVVLPAVPKYSELLI